MLFYQPCLRLLLPSPGELCKALRSLPGLPLTGAEVRLLLAYLFHFGDKDQ